MNPVTDKYLDAMTAHQMGRCHVCGRPKEPTPCCVECAAILAMKPTTPVVRGREDAA